MNGNLVNIINSNDIELKINKKLIRSVSEFALNYLKKTNYETSVVIENLITIRKLNKTFRKVNSATDVLSFPAHELNPDSGKMYIGDIVISPDYINKKAASLHVPFEQNVARVIIHGVLHLLGFDHNKKEDERAMLSLQEEILRAYFKSRPQPLIDTFGNAFRGISAAYKSEKNLKIHLFISALAVLLGFMLKISIFEWGLLVLTISSVFMAEMLNTALEYLVNLVSPNYHQFAKKSKDIGAAAVFIAVIGSIIIGIIIFLPGLIILIQNFLTN